MTVTNNGNANTSWFSMPSLTRAAVTAAVSSYCGSVAANVVYQHAPALITNSVVSAAKRQFGFFLGTLIGNAAAPTAVAQLMPRLVAGAYVGGALVGTAAAVYTFNRINQHQQEARTRNAYQQECQTIAQAADLNGGISDNDEEDFVAVGLGNNPAAVVAGQVAAAPALLPAV